MSIYNGFLRGFSALTDAIAAAVGVYARIAQVDHILVNAAPGAPGTIYQYDQNGITVLYASVGGDTVNTVAAALKAIHNTLAGVFDVTIASNTPPDDEYDVTAIVAGVPFVINAVSANLTLSHPTPSSTLISSIYTAVMTTIPGVLTTIENIFLGAGTDLSVWPGLSGTIQSHVHGAQDDTKLVMGAVDANNAAQQMDHVHVDGIVFPHTYSYTIDGALVQYVGLVADGVIEVAAGLAAAHNAAMLFAPYAPAVYTPGDHEYNVLAAFGGRAFSIGAIDANLTVTYPNANGSTILNIHDDTNVTVLSLRGTDAASNVAVFNTQEFEHRHNTNTPVGTADYTLFTCATERFHLTSLVVDAVVAAPADFVSIEIRHVRGGTGVNTFFDTTAGAQVNLNAAGRQITWTGGIRMIIGDLIIARITGTAGGSAQDLYFLATGNAIANTGTLTP